MRGGRAPWCPPAARCAPPPARRRVPRTSYDGCVPASLHLLGVPRQGTAGHLTDLPLDKPASLLYYLARRADWVGRGELAFLYRPDAPEATALGNVRVLLYRARARPWAAALEVEKLRLRLRVDTDVARFEAALERGDWQAALSLYRGPFLEGLRLDDVPGYDTWLELERQDLGRRWRTAVLSHAAADGADGGGAEAALERLLRADPLDEEALQAYLRRLLAEGRRARAAAAFEAFRDGLARELRLEPLRSTRALLEPGPGPGPGPWPWPEPERGASPSPPASPPHHAPSPHDLPATTTRFVGRARELTLLREALSGPDGRLVTLVGLGGAGKTRLALEFAAQQHDQFPDGVSFAPLAGVASPELLVDAVATAVGVALAGARDPHRALAAFLREKHLLLVLDNFDELVEGGALVADLLRDAPGVKVVVTSRVALELNGERILDVGGLAYPPTDATEPIEGYDAVRLFIERAARRSSGFVASGETLEAVARLCRKVEGLPLALELAATWTRSVGVVELLRELEGDLGALDAPARDLPERHRSLRTVVEASWRRLPAAERGALSALAVFPTGFTLEAARTVAQTHLALLLGLVNHSMLRRDDGGRYAMHELVRHYALEQLDAVERARLERLLSAYVLRWLRRHAEDLRGPRHADAIAALSAEGGSVRAACDLALDHGAWSELDGSLRAIYRFHREAGTLRDGRAVFAHVVDAAQAAGAARPAARARMWLGVFERHLGRFEDAKGTLRQALAELRELDAVEDLTFGMQVLGTAYRETGDAVAAEATILRALALGDATYRAEAIFALALVRRDQGRREEARDLLGESVALYQKRGDDVGSAVASAQLALVLGHLGAPAGSVKRHTLRALAVFRRLGQRKNEAVALNNLADIAHDEGDDDACLRLLGESLEIKRHLGDVDGQVTTLLNLGALQRELGRPAEAVDRLAAALALSRRHRNVRGELNVLAELAETSRRLGDAAEARDHFLRMLRLASGMSVPPRHLLDGLSYLAAFHAGTGSTREAATLYDAVAASELAGSEIRSAAREARRRLARSLDADAAAAMPAAASPPSLAALIAGQIEVLARAAPPASPALPARARTRRGSA